MDHVDRIQVRDLIEKLQQYDPRMRVKLSGGELDIIKTDMTDRVLGNPSNKVLILASKPK